MPLPSSGKVKVTFFGSQTSLQRSKDAYKQTPLLPEQLQLCSSALHVVTGPYRWGSAALWLTDPHNFTKGFSAQPVICAFPVLLMPYKVPVAIAQVSNTAGQGQDREGFPWCSSSHSCGSQVSPTHPRTSSTSRPAGIAFLKPRKEKGGKQKRIKGRY